MVNRNSPHTLSPDQLYQAHLTPYLTQVEKVVSERIEDTKSQNEVLAKDVLAQRAEIRDLIAGLESVVGDLRGAAKAAEKFEKENDLHQENIQMDEEVRARPV